MIESVHAPHFPSTGEVSPMGLAAVIPAYNEGLVIGSVVLQALQHVSVVIVVDDGSTDRTASVARLAGADVIRLEENSGKASAMMAGFARDPRYEAVVMLSGEVDLHLRSLLWRIMKYCGSWGRQGCIQRLRVPDGSANKAALS